jgi:hypothetical protein
LVTAAGAAGSWVLPDAQWQMVAGVAWVVAGAAATLVAGARLMAEHDEAWRLLVAAGVVALVVGLAASTAMAWALGGAAADDVDDARAAGRVALGLLFAVAVVAAAGAAILLGRAQPPAAGHRQQAGPATGDARVGQDAGVTT